jgi:hypothetical protein
MQGRILRKLQQTAYRDVLSPLHSSNQTDVNRIERSRNLRGLVTTVTFGFLPLIGMAELLLAGWNDPNLIYGFPKEAMQFILHGMERATKKMSLV